MRKRTNRWGGTRPAIQGGFEVLNALRQTAEGELAKENGPNGDAIRAPAWNQILIRVLATTRNVQLFCSANVNNGLDVEAMRDAAEFATGLRIQSARR